MQNVFITGSSGYIGTRLINALNKERNYSVQALVRKGSENKLPQGCEIVTGNALDASSYGNSIRPHAVFVHLVGAAHPSPSKKELFKKIDLVSIQEAAKAAVAAGCDHFIYLSVSMYPTNIMKDFQAVRVSGEKILSETGIKTSFIRPWYVLGPGHWWPLLLKPFYYIARFTKKKEAAAQLGTVTIRQMIRVLVYAIDHPPQNSMIYDVQKIKTF